MTPDFEVQAALDALGKITDWLQARPDWMEEA